ncbi:MAG: hypothetical protein ACFCUI_04335 [Bernardetiaceae bacterium]
MRSRLFILLLVIFCWGCGKDDDSEPPTTTELITGTAWVVEDAKIDIGALGQSFGDSLDLFEDLRRNSLQLLPDGRLEVTEIESGRSEIAGTWNLLDDNTIRFQGLIDEDFVGTDTGSIEFTQAQLENLQTFTIVEITPRNFVLSNQNNFIFSLPDIPIPIQVTVKLDITLIPKS